MFETWATNQNIGSVNVPPPQPMNTRFGLPSSDARITAYVLSALMIVVGILEATGSYYLFRKWLNHVRSSKFATTPQNVRVDVSSNFADSHIKQVSTQV